MEFMCAILDIQLIYSEQYTGGFGKGYPESAKKIKSCLNHIPY